jgi:hypothetical protein
MRLRLALYAGVLAACHASDPDQPDGGDGVPDGTPPDAWVDQAGPLFDPDHVVDVRLELAAADWDTLRDQTRTIPMLLANCGAGPFPDPFTYVHAAVTVDGHRFDDVGLRKKGFLGSMDTERPSLKIKLDEYVDDQRVYGRKTLTLNNAKQDPSLLRTCLSYQVFAAAGIPTPRCNFAHVRVNEHDLGVYVDVEAMNKDFLRVHFADPEGTLYEGTLSDFRDDWMETFEQKTNESTPDRAPLDRLTAALEVPDDQLLAALDDVIDVDAFVRFWAAEILVSHWDGFASNTNNYGVYADPSTGKLVFLPWGPDMSFVSIGSPFNLFSPISVQAQSMLARRLYLLPSTRYRYVAAMRELLDDVWDETALLAEIDRIEALIQPYAGRDLAVDIQGVRDYVTGRRAAIENELFAAAPPEWTTPLRTVTCVVPIGQVAGSFTTTWGTDGSWFPFSTGDGTFTGAIDGVPLSFVDVGATSGVPLVAVQAQVTVVGKLADGTFVSIVIGVTQPERWFLPESDHPLDWAHVNGIVYHYATLQIPTIVGLVTDGELHLADATMTDGAPISGTFTGQVLWFAP